MGMTVARIIYSSSDVVISLQSTLGNAPANRQQEPATEVSACAELLAGRSETTNCRVADGFASRGPRIVVGCVSLVAFSVGVI